MALRTQLVIAASFYAMGWIDFSDNILNEQIFSKREGRRTYVRITGHSSEVLKVGRVPGSEGFRSGSGLLW